MAFPTVVDADTKNGTVVANSNSWTITYPTNVAAGDLLMLFVGTDGNSVGSATGFQQITTTSNGSATVHCFAKIAAGTETGTFTFSLDVTEQGGWRICRISAASWHGGALAITESTSVASSGLSSTTGTDNLPNPPALNPTNWNVEDTLWFAACGVDTSRTFVSFPGSYTNTSSDVSGGAGGASLGLARRENAVASEDPGTFQISASDDWAAMTVAVRPAVVVAAQVPYHSPYPQLLVQ